LGREKNEVEQTKQVNAVSIIDVEDIQNFEFPCQKSSKHREIVTTGYEICGEVQG